MTKNQWWIQIFNVNLQFFSFYHRNAMPILPAKLFTFTDTPKLRVLMKRKTHESLFLSWKSSFPNSSSSTSKGT